MKTCFLVFIPCFIFCTMCNSHEATLIANCRLETQVGTFIPKKVLVELYNEKNHSMYNRSFSDNNGVVIFKDLPKGQYTVRSIWIDASKNLNEYTQTVFIDNLGTIERNILMHELLK